MIGYILIDYINWCKECKDYSTMLSEKEKKKRVLVLHTMISLYCNKTHQTKYLCKECEELNRYASRKLDECHLLDDMFFCSSCNVHCYDEYHRDRIKQVMKFSGKRMIFYHPVMALRHIIETLIRKIR